MTEQAIQIQLPPSLTKLVRDYVQQGWAPDLNTLIAEALRRYLEAHRADLQEQFIHQDVAWGLYGDT